MEGSIGIVEILATMRAYSTDPTWRPSFNRLWDGRRIRELVLMPENIREVQGLIAQIQRRIGNGQLAFVAARELDMIVAELFRLLFPSHRIAVFEDYLQALTWLGITPPDLMHDLWETL